MNAYILWVACNRSLPSNKHLFGMKVFKEQLVRTLYFLHGTGIVIYIYIYNCVSYNIESAIMTQKLFSTRYS